MTSGVAIVKPTVNCGQLAGRKSNNPGKLGGNDSDS
jgi:hypothetical protein